MITPKVSKPYGSKAEAVVEISPGARATSSARRLISVYLLGYSVIHVKGKEGALTSNQRNAIKEVMRRHLIGTEIISESNEEITLQVLLSYPDLSVKSVVKRMFLITTAMHKDVMVALKDFTKDSATGIMNSDDEVDRFSLYAIRQLNIIKMIPAGVWKRRKPRAQSLFQLGNTAVEPDIQRGDVVVRGLQPD